MSWKYEKMTNSGKFTFLQTKTVLDILMEILIHIYSKDKNLGKTNDEISKRKFPKNRFFFRKSGSVTFWVLPFCIFVSNS